MEKVNSADLRARIFDTSVPDWAFVTEDELCTAFECSPTTLADWKRGGNFPNPVKIPGGVCYPLSAIREFLKRRANEAKKAATNLKSPKLA